MTVYVPSNVVRYIQQASDQTGLSYQICACQCSEESGFNQYAVSPTGAQGPWQFEPSTWASWGHGSPFDWQDSTNAYVAFMHYLIVWSGDVVRMALAAYNAGQGNWQAGLGYADIIINCAGGGTGVKGSTTSHTETLPSAPGGVNSGDDWSAMVGNSGGQLGYAAVNASRAADFIGRL